MELQCVCICRATRIDDPAQGTHSDYPIRFLEFRRYHWRFLHFSDHQRRLFSSKWSAVVVIIHESSMFWRALITVAFKYSEGRTLYTTNVVLGADIIFPEITVCLNSMHSRELLGSLVSDFDLSQVMWAFYGYGYILDSEVKGFQVRIKEVKLLFFGFYFLHYIN